MPPGTTRKPDPKPDAIRLPDVPGGPAAGEVLCQLDDIADGASKTFVWRQDSRLFEMFIQRLGDHIFAYENMCPHVGLPLNMRPDRFLDFEGTSLFCVNHGAYFQIEDGLCTKGPCRNKWLVPVAVSLMEDGRIVVG